MKYLYSLLWLCTVFFFSCNGGLPDAEETEGEIEIFPDYKGVAVPCNIAPLNFKLKEPWQGLAGACGFGQRFFPNPGEEVAPAVGRIGWREPYGRDLYMQR